MGQPSAQHYVPKCYLKHFANTQKQFYSYTRGGNKIVLVSTTQVCYLHNYYNFNTEIAKNFHGIESETYIEENAFKIQENNYSKNLKVILKNSHSAFQLNKVTIYGLLNTLITIKRRNPVYKIMLISKMIEDNSENDYIDFMQNSFANQGFSIEITTSDEFINDIKKSWLRLKENRDKQSDLYLSGFINNDESIKDFTNTLMNHKLYLLSSEVGSEFITSDNPGFFYTNGTPYNIGKLDEEFEFYFPITPNFCICILSGELDHDNNNEKYINLVNINKTKVRFINNLSAEISNKKIFSNNFEELNLIKLLKRFI